MTDPVRLIEGERQEGWTIDPEWHSNLFAEMAEYAKHIKLKHCQHLAALGVKHWPHITGAGHLGFARIEIDKRDLWQPIETGKPHLIIPVFEGTGMVDLIAFDPGNPDFWALRTGLGWALGADEIYAARAGWNDEQRTLRVAATPLEWLTIDGPAACIIDGWSWHACAELREVPFVQVANNNLARVLRLQLSKPPRIPEIMISGGERHAA